MGCTALELLTGKPPYFELSKASACFKMVQDPHPPLPDNVSAELRAFLMRCFRKEPKERATAAELLQDEWLTDKTKKAELRKHTRCGDA